MSTRKNNVPLDKIARWSRDVREAVNEASKEGSEFKEALEIVLRTGMREFSDSVDVVGINLYSCSVDEGAKHIVVAPEVTFGIV